MPDLRDIAITLACGRFVRRVTPEALAAALGLATVRPALLSLLLRPGEPDTVPAGPSPSGEPTEGERSFGTNVNVPENILIGNVHERALVPRTNVAPERARDLADHLAQALDDPASLLWFRKVVQSLDEATVTNALDRALRVPEHAIRRSRAAYFTGIVAPLLRRTPAAEAAHAPRP
ncbi:MAG: hypothetical protein IT379_30480 [Deltaproteobacteria bacterium]|nr:hypothetical protein [Deltaproteobacteria bacterium]